VPRLRDGDVRLSAGPRPARSLGPAHGPRAGRRRLGVHDEGDRRGDRAGRDAGAGGRRSQARRGPRRDRARRGRGVRDRPGRGARARPGRARRGRRARRRQHGRGGRGRRRQRHADAALRAPPRRCGGAEQDDRGSPQVPVRPRRDADPHGALGATAVGGGRAAGADGDRPRHSRARRGLARRERGRPRAPARRGDDRLRPADHGRPLAGARRRVDPLDPAPGAALARQGRRGRRARRRRRSLDGGSARALRRPHPGPSGPPDREPRLGPPEPGRALAGRSRGSQRELRGRRHLQRLLRARPEPRLAPAARATGPRDAGGGPLPHRREHPSRPRSRGRLGDARGERAPQATASEPGPTSSVRCAATAGSR
jgi:hypothetical protein